MRRGRAPIEECCSSIRLTRRSERDPQRETLIANQALQLCRMHLYHVRMHRRGNVRLPDAEDMAPPEMNSGGSIVLLGVPELRKFPTRLDRQRALAGVAYEADQFGTRRGLAGLAIYITGMFIGAVIAAMLGELLLTGGLSPVNLTEEAKLFAMIGGTIGFLAAMCWQHRRVGRQVLRRHLVCCGVPVCLRCGYDLRGLRADTAHCPECGDVLHEDQQRLLLSTDP